MSTKYRITSDMDERMRIRFSIDRYEKHFILFGEWIRVKSWLDSLEDAESYLKQLLAKDTEAMIIEKEISNYGTKVHKVIE
jgi:hypothetical protein